MSKTIDQLVSGSPAGAMSDADAFELSQSAVSKGGLFSQLWTWINTHLATVATTGAANDLSSGTLAQARLPIVNVAHGGTGQSSAGATAANAIGALAEASNLSDLANAATARTNLGLAAVAASGAFADLSGSATAVQGGTGNISYAVGDILYASAGTTLARLADVATGNALISGGVGVAPSWGKVTLTGHVSGSLPIANGGTNASSASGTALDNITGFASTGLLKRTGAGAYSFIADGQLPATATNDDAATGKLGEYGNGAVSGRAATATITIASPGVVTWTAHGLLANQPVAFSTTGALPTGLSANTTYYVVGASITTNTFQLSIGPGGAAINTSGSQSGTHTANNAVALVSGSVMNVYSVALPSGGDYEVWVNAAFIGLPTTAVQSLIACLSTTNGTTLDTTPSHVNEQYLAGGTPYGQVNFVTLNVGPTRISVSGASTVWFNVFSSFSVAALYGAGIIHFRRAR